MTTDVRPTWRRAIAAARTVSVGHVVLVWALCVAVSVWLMDGGLLHGEISARMPIYLRHTSLYRIIFDSGMDTIPRPRQASFVFDVVDAHFIQLCARHGFPHFLSFTHYLFALGIALAMWRFLLRYVTDRRLVALLLIALLLSSRSFEISSIFRTAKVGAALVTAIYANLLGDLVTWDATERTRRDLVRYAVVSFAVAFVGGLFDEQSLFMSVLFIGLLAIWAWRKKSRAAAVVAAVSVVSLATVFVYYQRVFPRLYAQVNGAGMDYRFQTTLSPTPLNPKELGYTAVELVVDTARTVFGNLTRFQAVAALVVAVLTALVLRKVRRADADATATPDATPLSGAADRWTYLLTAALLGALVALDAGMLVKHPPVTWPDVRVTYYWMPAATLLAILVPWAGARLFRAIPARLVPAHRGAWLVAFLVASVGANLWSLPEHAATLRAGHLSGNFAWTKKFLPALLSPAAAREAYGARPPDTDPMYVLLKANHQRPEVIRAAPPNERASCQAARDSWAICVLVRPPVPDSAAAPTSSDSADRPRAAGAAGRTSRTSSPRKNAARRRRWVGRALLLAPTVCIVGFDLAKRHPRVLAFEGTDFLFYVGSVAVGLVVWGSLVGVATRTRGIARWPVRVILALAALLPRR